MVARDTPSADPGNQAPEGNPAGIVQQRLMHQVRLTDSRRAPARHPAVHPLRAASLDPADSTRGLAASSSHSSSLCTPTPVAVQRGAFRVLRPHLPLSSLTVWPSRPPASRR